MLDGPALQVTPKGLRFLASGLRTPPLSNVKDSLSLSLRVDCQDMVSLGDMIQHNPQVKARTPVLCPVSSVGKRLDVCEVGLSHVGRAAHHFIESIWLGHEI
jgi:hypothetical protein